MATVFHQLSRFTNFAGGFTRYCPTLANGSLYSNEITEANTELINRTAGTYSNLYCRVQSGSNAASTVQFRKNTANGNQVLSIGAAASGEFEDTSNTDDVVDSNTTDISTTGAGSTGTMAFIAVLFSATTDTSQRLGPSGGETVLGAVKATVGYHEMGGFVSDEAIEANATFDYNTAGTLHNLQVYISANDISDIFSVTYAVRKNGANVITMLVPGMETGSFENYTTDASIAANDDCNFSISVPAATYGTSLTHTFIAIDFVTTNKKFHVILGSDGGWSQAFATSRWNMVSGDAVNTTAEAGRVEMDTNIQATASNLYARVSANTVNNTSSVTLRKNAANSALTISVASTTTGSFEDAVNTVALVATDEINYQFTTTGTAGNITWKITGMMLENIEVSTAVKDIIQAGIIPFAR